MIGSKPTFCLTLDLEWVGEPCLESVLSLLDSFQVPFTVFITHRSRVLQEYAERTGRVHLGLHPNFLARSTHGVSESEVVEHCFGLLSEARCFRSHAFYENTPLLRELVRRGIRYDSNLCLYLQENLVPLCHATGLVRFPVFWEDDVHFCREQVNWEFAHYREIFSSPGLKVLNVHPQNVALNVPDERFYRKVKEDLGAGWGRVSAQRLEAMRWNGRGTATFLTEIIDFARKNGFEMLHLGELYQRYSQSPA